MLFALGLGDEVTAVTHECDHPAAGARAAEGHARPDRPRARRRRRSTARCASSPSRARRSTSSTRSALRDLQPDLIVTQALCAVCAVSYDDVKAVAERIEPEPQVLSLDPHTLGEVLGDVRTLAEATDARGRRRRPRAGRRRAGSTACGSRCATQPPVRVAALEWLDPVFVAGHWTPQLIEYAGGVDVLGLAGEHSEVRTWEEVAAAQPEVVVVMPCGYDAERALEEAYALRRRARGDRRAARRRGRRRRLLLAPRPAARRRARAARPHPAPRPRPRGARRGARGRALEADLRRAPRSRWRPARRG